MSFAPTVLGSGPGGFAFLERTRARQQSLFQQTPQIARETNTFATRIASVQSSEELMADRSLRQVALGAFGLEDDIDNIGFIQKILDSDLSDSSSLANRLADKRYLALAQSFNFAGEGGARLPNEKTADEITQQLQSLASSDDLMSDRTLLRSALQKFGLEDYSGNTYFLQQVVESDLSDENAFVFQLSDTRLVEFARTFNFAEKAKDNDGFDAIATTFEGTFDTIRTADDLLANDALLTAALDIFDLENVIYNTDFLRDVLNSDLTDETSVALQQDDPRFAALSRAFGYGNPPQDVDGNPLLDDNGDPVIEKSRLELFVEVVRDRDGPTETPTDFFSTPKLMLAAFNLFDLPQGVGQTDFVRRYLESDAESPTSLRNVFPDPRYEVFAKQFNFQPEQTERTYPDGFVEEITQNYLDRQFEIAIGNVDSTMRVALAFERDLGDSADRGTSNNSRWFSIMSSPVLREVFETSFQLPSSFGTLDIDQQLKEFKDRATRVFGTDEVTDFLAPDKIDEIRERYLSQSSFQGGNSTGISSVALSILQS